MVLMARHSLKMIVAIEEEYAVLWIGAESSSTASFKIQCLNLGSINNASSGKSKSIAADCQ